MSHEAQQLPLVLLHSDGSAMFLLADRKVHSEKSVFFLSQPARMFVSEIAKRT
jgi:hypothetical protein